MYNDNNIKRSTAHASSGSDKFQISQLPERGAKKTEKLIEIFQVAIIKSFPSYLSYRFCSYHRLLYYLLCIWDVDQWLFSFKWVDLFWKAKKKPAVGKSIDTISWIYSFIFYIDHLQIMAISF